MCSTNGVVQFFIKVYITKLGLIEPMVINTLS
jgi:hypothetical protein